MSRIVSFPRSCLGHALAVCRLVVASALLALPAQYALGAAADASPLPADDGVLAYAEHALGFEPNPWADPRVTAAGAQRPVTGPGTEPAPKPVTSTPATSASGNALVAQALTLEHGEGVPRDPQGAADLYCAAARLGNADGQFNLGWMYANGRGVSRNDPTAAALFAMAARQGHRQAEEMLVRVGGRPAGNALPSCLTRPEPPVELAASPAPAPAPAARAAVPVDELKAPAKPSHIDIPREQKWVADLVKKLAPQYKIDPRLALAVISAESGFDVKARSPKNAQGLMQLIPETAERFAVQDPNNPVQNLRGGLAYLRWLLSHFRGDVTLALAGYNAGEGTVSRYRGIPPYPETLDYVRKILDRFGRELHPYDPSITAPSPMLRAVPRRPVEG